MSILFSSLLFTSDRLGRGGGFVFFLVLGFCENGNDLGWEGKGWFSVVKGCVVCLVQSWINRIGMERSGMGWDGMGEGIYGPIYFRSEAL